MDKTESVEQREARLALVLWLKELVDDGFFDESEREWVAEKLQKAGV